MRPRLTEKLNNRYNFNSDFIPLFRQNNKLYEKEFLKILLGKIRENAIFAKIPSTLFSFPESETCDSYRSIFFEPIMHNFTLRLSSCVRRSLVMCLHDTCEFDEKSSFPWFLSLKLFCQTRHFFFNFEVLNKKEDLLLRTTQHKFH